MADICEEFGLETSIPELDTMQAFSGELYFAYPHSFTCETDDNPKHYFINGVILSNENPTFIPNLISKSFTIPLVNH